MKQSYVILLFLLSGLVCLATGATNGTLCTALRHGRYKEMGLLSITWYDFGKSLCLFTEPGYRYYEVPLEKVTDGSMDLSMASPLNMADHDKFKAIFASVLDDKPKGTYIFFLYNFWQVWKYDWKELFLIVTDKGTRSGSYIIPPQIPQKGLFTEITEPDGQPLPDFTLASLTYERFTFRKNILGYVIFEGKQLCWLLAACQV